MRDDVKKGSLRIDMSSEARGSMPLLERRLEAPIPRKQKDWEPQGLGSWEEVLKLPVKNLTALQAGSALIARQMKRMKD